MGWHAYKPTPPWIRGLLVRCLASLVFIRCFGTYVTRQTSGLFMQRLQSNSTKKTFLISESWMTERQGVAISEVRNGEASLNWGRQTTTFMRPERPRKRTPDHQTPFGLRISGFGFWVRRKCERRTTTMTSEGIPDESQAWSPDLISHNVLIRWLQKVNPPPKKSTCYFNS